MRHILQKPTTIDPAKKYPLWLFLHGAYDLADQAIALFGKRAESQDAYLLAPQASRPCGDGFCWSFAKDAADIKALFANVLVEEQIDPAHIHLVGFSMGCTIGCWVVAQHPQTFATFSALGMGSAFEPWDLDDGGIDREGMALSAESTRVLLAVDQGDPNPSNDYFDQNLDEFRNAGLAVTTFQPNFGTHDVTDAMKDAVLEFIRR